MKRIILTAALLIAAPVAFAQVNIGSGTQSNSEAASKAHQQQGLTNAPVNVIEASEIPSYTEQKIRNTPGIALGGPASGPCNGFSAGIGLSVPGFGLAGNMSKVDEGCEERETARIAALMGRMDIANLVLEEMAVVKRAKERRAQAQPAQQPAKKAEVAPIAQPQLVAATTQMTPSEQTRNICENAKLTGDHIIASRLNCPK
jgi:hypothetical protein